MAYTTASDSFRNRRKHSVGVDYPNSRNATSSTTMESSMQLRRSLSLISKRVRPSLEEDESKFLTEFSWFGIDIGGSLSKIVLFEPKDRSTHETESEVITLKNIRNYLEKHMVDGEKFHVDLHLQMDDVFMGGRKGTLHFIRFPTCEMNSFLELAKSINPKNLNVPINVCATGGGAFKFEKLFVEEINLNLHKYDELDSLISGLEFLEANNFCECFYLENPKDDGYFRKVVYDFRNPYPFMVVNIGSGVSILAVDEKSKFRRISGTSLGGGTFLGLCSLLTGCKSFDEAIELASRGDSKGVDKLVRDIYGGSYDKFNLDGDVIASSFGQMIHHDRREKVSKEDLARATLTTITTNIGSISRMCALNEGITRVIFIGNFLRSNKISMQLLSHAMDYWSEGSLKALFLEHEGYFGAVGCLLERIKDT